MRVLLINQTFYPDVAATAQYASDLAENLVREGHRVTVASSRRSYVDPAVTFPRSEYWRGVHIVRSSSSGFGKGARWRRAADFATFFLSCAVRVCLVSRFDVVVALTSPPLVSALGAAVASINGARFVYWVMDLNPDQAIAAGWLKEKSAAAWALNAVLRFSLRRADMVVALDRFMAARLAEKGVPAARLSVIPLWPQDDSVEFDPGAAAEFRARHSLAGKFVVMYSGNHSPCHPVATLLEAALLLREEPRVAFCFVGGGSEFERVGAFALTHGLDNIVRIPYQPREALSASLSAADLHVVVMGDPFVGMVHPSKVYNIIRVGAPFLYIGPEQGPIEELGPAASFRHGESRPLADYVAAAADSTVTVRPPFSAPGAVSRSKLIKQLIAAIGGKPRHEFEQPVRG